MGKKLFIFALSIFLLISIVFIVRQVYAHCDTLDGPVIQDAKAALDKGDVTPVLKWIKKDAESEVRSVFQFALSERKTNEEKADTKFFEILVRIHRQGEGASFEGLKTAGAAEPIVTESDKALESGSADELLGKMSGHLTKGVKERFDRVLEAKKHKDESVDSGREYVEAYVTYMHYVEGIHKAIEAQGDHLHEGPVD